MRLLHTSDWHLGQHFMGKSRAPEHRAFMEWLLTTIDQQQVDVLLVAGDLFDTGTPPSYARELYNRFIVRLQQSGCQLVVLGGNHDSVATLHESRELLSCLNTQVIGGIGEAHEQQLLTLCRRSGEPAAILCAVPFLRPRDLLTSQAGQSGADKQQALQQAIGDYYAELYRLAEQRREALGGGLPILASGHLTMVGGTSSESVREIYIGTLEALPANALPPLDYMALGHLHKPQQVAGLEHIRYCGSPIPLSFDEAGHDKQVLLVEFAGGALARVTPLRVPLSQPLQLLKGDLEQIAAQLDTLCKSCGDTGTPIWLDIEVEGDDYLSDLQSRVQQLVEGKPVEVLRLRRKRGGQSAGLTTESRATLSELRPDEVFARRLEQETFADEQDVARLTGLFSQVVAELVDESALADGEPGEVQP